MPRSFRPTLRQSIALAALALTAFACALAVRHRVIEHADISARCASDPLLAWCRARDLVIALFQRSVFGFVALAAAIIHVIRPSTWTLATGLVAAGLGIVLYNIDLSALALALMVLGFARPAREQA